MLVHFSRALDGGTLVIHCTLQVVLGYLGFVNPMWGSSTPCAAPHKWIKCIIFFSFKGTVIPEKTEVTTKSKPELLSVHELTFSLEMHRGRWRQLVNGNLESSLCRENGQIACAFRRVVQEFTRTCQAEYHRHLVFNPHPETGHMLQQGNEVIPFTHLVFLKSFLKNIDFMLFVWKG